MNMSLEKAHLWAYKTLRENGCNHENANALASSMCMAERDICLSHGLFRLPGYVASLKSGKVDGSASPSIEKIAPSVLRADGKGAFAPLALDLSIAPLAKLTKEQGIAVLGVVDIYHFSALWIEVSKLADEGLVAMAMTCSNPMVAPAGGTKPLFGTNPLAFAWPRKNKPPLVFDMATATMARGEIMLAARDGHILPDGVGIDKNGTPTNDPNAIIDGGAQLAFGGYKGSALSLMIELLAGPLIGEFLSMEAGAHGPKDGGPSKGGEFIIAIDPEKLTPSGEGGEKYDAHAEQLFDALLAQEGARLPADRRYKNRTVTDEKGIEMNQDLFAKIDAIYPFNNL